MLPPLELLFCAEQEKAVAPAFAGVTASVDTVSLTAHRAATRG